LQVTEADIEEFEANYRGSDSEKKDLIDLYKKYKGNMNRYKSNVLASFMKPCQFDLLSSFLYRLFCSMLCSDPKLDSHRFKDILDEAIAAGKNF
jgi:DnaJ family protein C protein 9